MNYNDGEWPLKGVRISKDFNGYSTFYNRGNDERVETKKNSTLVRQKKTSKEVRKQNLNLLNAIYFSGSTIVAFRAD